jgi:hypothetical protein
MQEKIVNKFKKKRVLIPTIIIGYFILLSSIPKAAGVAALVIGIIVYQKNIYKNEKFKSRNVFVRGAMTFAVILLTFFFTVGGLFAKIKEPDEVATIKTVAADKTANKKQQEAEKKAAEEKIKAEKEAKEAADKAEKEKIAKEQAEKEAAAKAEREKYLSQFTWHDDNFGVILDSGSVSYGFFNGKGRLISLKNKDYSYVQVEIGLYSENGNKIGDALANTSSLTKGTTWQFKAVGTVSTSGNVKWKVESVTGF